MKVPHHAWAFALTIGPCAAYLVWAIQRGYRGHMGAAILANMILWTGGPALIGVILSWLS